MRLRLIFSLMLLLMLPTLTEANEKESPTQQINVGEWHLSAAIGYGYIDNPRVKSNGATTYFLPSVSYYGERFYLENTTLGYSLYEDDYFLLDLQSKLNEDAFHFEIDGLKNVLLSEVFGYSPIAVAGPEHPKQPRLDVTRRISYMAGLHALMPTDLGNFSLGIYQDISAVHYGHEVQARFSRTFQYEHWAMAIEAGLTYKNNELLNYYYSVFSDDNEYYEELYAGSKRLSHHLRWVGKLPLNERWSAVGIIEYNGLAEAIQRSRLIEDDEYWGAFVGFSYAF